MKASRQVALSAVLMLLLTPALALAESVYVSQSLPPMQGAPYGSNTGFNNSYNNPGYNNGGGFNQNGYGQYGQAPLQGYVVTAPPGTVVQATVSNSISSEYARVGETVRATLGSAIVGGSSVILPAGSQVEGQVVMAKPAGRVGRNGELEIRFTSAILPNGARLPLSARIKTDDGTGILKGGSTGGRFGRAAVTTGVGAGLGAALGTAMGPLSGGGVGRGAIYGTTLGAGMGALGSAIQKGTAAILDSSQPINIVLDQPLTSTASQDNNGGGGYYQQNYQQPTPPQFNNNYYGQ